MTNPFSIKELPPGAPFCDRNEELDALARHARNRANVVLFSPRRYGKTSLVRRVQHGLAEEGIITLYINLFGVDSVDDVAGRMARQMYDYCRDDDGLFTKAMKFISAWRPVLRPDPESGISLSVEPTTRSRGIELMDETLSGVGAFMKENGSAMSIVLDEFQEISELRESLQVEGIMRSHIQTHDKASYFFVGSRRRILTEIFSQRKRPFYQSAVTFQLPPLPVTDATGFIVDRFAGAGKRCPEDIARRIAERAEGYPYYIQRVSYCIFDLISDEVTENDLTLGIRQVLDEERVVFEAMLQVLAPEQIKLLGAISAEPTDKPYSSRYMSRFGLGSVGGVQGAIRRLIDLDYLEKRDGVLRVVDPIFGMWIRRLKGYR